MPGDAELEVAIDQCFARTRVDHVHHAWYACFLDFFTNFPSFLRIRALEHRSIMSTRIDCDRSGLLTLGEFIVYSYRNRELQEMIQTVPTEDNRIFEDSVPFQRRAIARGRVWKPLILYIVLKSCSDAQKCWIQLVTFSGEEEVGRTPSTEPMGKRMSLREEPFRKRFSLEVPEETGPMSARTVRRRSTQTGRRPSKPPSSDVGKGKRTRL